MAKKHFAIQFIGISTIVGIIGVGSSTLPANSAETVTVFAASSLTDSYIKLGKQFERVYPGTKVVFSFQASSTLITQITNGAPADILVSAEPFYGGTNYVTNRVVVAVPKNSEVIKISDLDKVRWIQCAHEVPCGIAADSALKDEMVKSKPISLEPKVTSVVAKLLAGEVDAAIIYFSDVLTNKNKLSAIEFSNRNAAKNTYQIALLRKNRSSTAFIKFLQSRTTLRFLQSKGFETK